MLAESKPRDALTVYSLAAPLLVGLRELPLIVMVFPLRLNPLFTVLEALLITISLHFATLVTSKSPTHAESSICAFRTSTVYKSIVSVDHDDHSLPVRSVLYLAFSVGTWLEFTKIPSWFCQSKILLPV